MYGMLESAAEGSGHNLTRGRPLLGLSDPDARPDVQWSPAEALAISAWQRENGHRDSKAATEDTHRKGAAQGEERTLFRRRRQFAKADLGCGETSRSSQATRTAEQRRKGQRTRGKNQTRVGIFVKIVLATVHGSSRDFKVWHRSRTCQFFMRPRELGLRTSHLGVDRKRCHTPLTSVSPARAAIVPSLGWLPACEAHDFCNAEDPDALGHDSSLFAVTQQQWRGCVCRMVRWQLAYITIFFSGSQISFRSVRGLKDEGRDRFIGDRRPSNSRERSIGRAHVPCCPRLRRMILGKSETVQITVRDTKDCFHL